MRYFVTLVRTPLQKVKQEAMMEKRVERGRVGEGEGGGEGEWGRERVGEGESEEKEEWGRGRMGKRESNELLGWEGSVINN